MRMPRLPTAWLLTMLLSPAPTGYAEEAGAVPVGDAAAPAATAPEPSPGAVPDASTAAPAGAPDALAPATDVAAPAAAERRFSVAGEVGWNGLAGLGPVLSWRFAPHFAADAGVGLAGTGLKGGARLRWNPVAGRWSPVLAAGVMLGSGLPDDPLEMEMVERGVVYRYAYRILPSPFVQAVTGVEYLGPSGFTWLLTVGYARLLRDNLEILSGSPSAMMRDAMRWAYGSGPVISTSFGGSF